MNSFEYLFIKNKIKMKNLVNLFTSILFAFSYSNAQSIAPQSINSSGTSVTQSNGSLSYTVGELVVLSMSDSDGNTLGGGFTSGAAISTASIQEPDVAVIDVTVYPNPTTDLITVAIQETKLSTIEIEITDLNGKVISTEKYSGFSTKIGINSSFWENGTYFLTLKDERNSVLGIYKIIKE